MRTTVTLDRDIYEAAKQLAKISGRRLGQVLSELARRGLTNNETQPRRGRRRFPVFDVPASAPMIPASRVQRAIDNGGLF